MQTTRRFFIQGITLTAIGGLFGINAVLAAPHNEPSHGGREPQRKSPDRRPPEPRRQERQNHQEPRRENRDRRPNEKGRIEERNSPQRRF